MGGCRLPCKMEPEIEQHYLYSGCARRYFSNDLEPPASDRRTGGTAKPPFDVEGHGWMESAQPNSESRRSNNDWKASSRHVLHRVSECLSQQRLDQPFRFLVPALTDLHMADHTLLVDEVHRGPIPVAIAIPRREVVVEGDGKMEKTSVFGRNMYMWGYGRGLRTAIAAPLIASGLGFHQERGSAQDNFGPESLDSCAMLNSHIVASTERMLECWAKG